MDASFWHQKWKKNETAFHQNGPHPFLIKFFSRLALTPGARVMVPLCGKTLDMTWLSQLGFHVMGVELSELAVQQFFEGVHPTISQAGPFKKYHHGQVEIFQGDFFQMPPELMGIVDAVYDRAALVALPAPMRETYAEKVKETAGGADQLLICYEYDQSLMEGPPFSISAGEIRRLYEGRYQIDLLENQPIPGGMKGKGPASENIWLLKAKP